MTPEEREKIVAEERAALAQVQPELRPMDTYQPPPKTAEDEAIEIWDQNSKVVAASRALSDDEYLVVVSNLLEKADYPLQDHVNETILVKEFMVHVVQVASMEDGELKTMLRLALLLDDGSTTSTCSSSFIKGFGMIWKHLKDEARKPYVALVVKSTPSRNKGNYYTCSYAGKQLDAPPADTSGRKPKKP